MKMNGYTMYMIPYNEMDRLNKILDQENIIHVKMKGVIRVEQHLESKMNMHAEVMHDYMHSKRERDKNPIRTSAEYIKADLFTKKKAYAKRMYGTTFSGLVAKFGIENANRMYKDFIRK